MSAVLIWMIIGIGLIVFELVITSVIAVFFGIGAIITAISLQLGLIESATSQYLMFSVVSIASLLLARKKLAHWFKGDTKYSGANDSSFQSDIGERATVIDDFDNGAGRVLINGVQWTAFCDEPLRAGDTAWVIANDGIQLTVKPQKPIQ